MNKRSAALMAAGLVAVLTLGGLAFSLGLTGPTASVAAPQAATAQRKPIVHTHTKRIVVHKQAPTPAPVIVPQSVPAFSTAPATFTTNGYDDGREGFDDDGGSGGGGGDD